MIPLETVDHDTFAPLIGRLFTTTSCEVSVELRLEMVRKLGNRRGDAARDPFSLSFRGPPGLRLPQGIYDFNCEDFGAIGLFITQVADGPEAAEFEAIFT